MAAGWWCSFGCSITIVDELKVGGGLAVELQHRVYQAYAHPPWGNHYLRVDLWLV